MTVQIRPLTLDDVGAWADLLGVVFERPPQQMHDLLHFLDEIAPLVACGAWADGKLIAQYSCLLRDVILPDGRRETAGHSLNMAVHPAYRGQGLVKQVAVPVYERVKERGGMMGVGFSNAAGVKVDKRSKGYGYCVVGKMRPYIALLTKQSRTPTRSVTTEKFQLDRSLEWIEKRFGQHPFRQYQFAYDEGGVVVYRPIEWANGRAISLLAVQSDDMEATIQRWVERMREQGVRAVHLLASPTATVLFELKKVARLIPQRYCRHQHYLTVKMLRPDTVHNLFEFDCWDCMGGDIL